MQRSDEAAGSTSRLISDSGSRFDPSIEPASAVTAALEFTKNSRLRASVAAASASSG
jgi:hypothetical protein